MAEGEYRCYLSDWLSTRKKQRIDKGTFDSSIRLTQSEAGDKPKIIRLAAPDAEAYSRHVGFMAYKSSSILVPEK